MKNQYLLESNLSNKSMRVKFSYLFCCFIVSICFFVFNASSQDQVPIQETPQLNELNEPLVSNASELAPKANELSDKYNKLLEIVFNFETFLNNSKEKLVNDKTTFATLKDVYTQAVEAKYSQFNKINEIGIAIKDFSSNVDKDIAEYTAKITELNTIKKEWETTKENWQKWRSDFYKEYNLIKDTFIDANKNITNALNDIAKIEKPLLATQTEFVTFQSEIKNTVRDIDSALATYKKDVFTKTDLSFFSRDFWNSFDLELLTDVKELAIASFSQFSIDISQKHIFLMIVNIILAIIIAICLKKLKNKDINRDNLKKLALRPFSTSLFISTILVGIYYGSDLPNLIKVILLVLVSISGARAVFCFIENSSRRIFLNILVIAFLLSRLFVIINIPEPLVRLYIALVTFFILILSLKYKKRKLKEDAFVGRDLLLNSVALLTFSSFIAELFGFSQLSLKIFDSSVRCLFSGILVWLLGVLVKEGVFVVLNYSWLAKFRVCKNFSYYILKRITVLINVVVTFLIFSIILVAWGIFDSVNKSIIYLLSLGFTIQGVKVSLGAIALAVFLFQLILFISWGLQRILEEEIYPRKKVQYGVQSSINRIIQYLFICVGVVVALSTVGFNLQNLAVIFGVLGVGIGFGLQNIVNNFASGLILLFERPIKVGDVIDLAGQKGTVRKIGLRATIVELFDKTEIIVPNSEIASTKVTNLTLSSRVIRSVVDVSVAYGSDIDKVIEVLLDIVKNKENVASDPEPNVVFLEFGASSLNFQIRFWSLFDNAAIIKNEINQDIYKRFAKEGIEIPFNKMDINLTGLTDKVTQCLDEDFVKNKVNK